METIKIINVVGARPNFMKIAPLIRAIDKHNLSNPLRMETVLVHTGQHYDYEMSRIFFKDLELPEPDIYLGVGSGSHSEQTGKVMIEFEKVLIDERPDLVIVVGDVNSTLACALASVKLHIPVAHVEAGLRSFDRSMPEEINRLLTDAISDYLFTPSVDADENLKNEGIPNEKIFQVGNVMVDNLLFNLNKARGSSILRSLNLSSDYAVITLHRPSNVDHKENLSNILEALKTVSSKLPIIFPIHPRTKRQIEAFSLSVDFKDIPPNGPGLYPLDPLGYLDFLNLMMNARFVMTDSGGIQEETTALDIPCLTLRNTTEWPVTIVQGTNTLVWNDHQKITREAFRILDGQDKREDYSQPWDGKAAERIIEVLGKKVYSAYNPYLPLERGPFNLSL